jgi:hypothetical protein
MYNGVFFLLITSHRINTSSSFMPIHDIWKKSIKKSDFVAKPEPISTPENGSIESPPNNILPMDVGHNMPYASITNFDMPPMTTLACFSS